MGWEDYKSPKWWMTSRRQCFPDTRRQCTYELTALLTTWTKPGQDQTRQSPSMGRRGGHKVLPLSEELLAFDGFSEEESQASVMVIKRSTILHSSLTLPRGSTAHKEAEPSHINQEHSSQTCLQAELMRHFFNQCPLFLGNSTLCQVDNHGIL